MIRIGFIGLPGTGKTTLARTIASLCYERLRKESYLVDEFARDFICNYGPIDSVADQVRIFYGQLEKEEKTPFNVDIMITDSPIFLGFMYSVELKKEDSKKDSMYLSDIFEKMLLLNTPPRYDILFFLSPVWELREDIYRNKLHYDLKWREEKNDFLKFLVKIFPPKKLFFIEDLSLKDRIESCFKYLEKEFK